MSYERATARYLGSTRTLGHRAGAPGERFEFYLNGSAQRAFPQTDFFFGTARTLDAPKARAR